MHVRMTKATGKEERCFANVAMATESSAKVVRSAAGACLPTPVNGGNNFTTELASDNVCC